MRLINSRISPRILVYADYASRSMVHGSWFMVHGSWFMVYGAWFMVHGSWFMVYGLWFMVHGSWFMVHNSWFMVHDSWFILHGSWFMVHGSWFMVHGSWPMVHGWGFRGKGKGVRVEKLGILTGYHAASRLQRDGLYTSRCSLLAAWGVAPTLKASALTPFPFPLNASALTGYIRRVVAWCVGGRTHIYIRRVIYVAL